jgi:maltooligosyltrehalose trehalohydrolase
MLFMGEEYGEKAPFQYFTSHGDANLIEAVRKGRREEFDDFKWEGEPPDPHDEETFRRSKLTREEDPSLRELYARLLRLRRETPSLRTLDLAAVETHADDERRLLLVRRGDVLLAFNFGEEEQRVRIPFAGTWQPVIDDGATIAGEMLTIPGLAFALFRSAAAQPPL